MWKITSSTSCGRKVCSTLGMSVAWALAGEAVRIFTGMFWVSEVLVQPASGSNSRTSILAFMASSFLRLLTGFCRATWACSTCAG
ncbi:hypothetical protein D3C85_1578350 [compost metagenome]